jgi:hypothetical protein
MPWLNRDSPSSPIGILRESADTRERHRQLGSLSHRPRLPLEGLQSRGLLCEIGLDRSRVVIPQGDLLVSRF